ncbi:MAG: trypsin-like peptidase domain-containing protein [Chthoniobacter sp.]
MALASTSRACSCPTVRSSPKCPAPWGTGFVISKDGYIVSNNHVVAPEESQEVPNKRVLVVQKIGPRYLMHKANVLWQSANRDLAIVQCPQLKATPLPLLLDEAKATASEEVFSMGFPGITDVSVEDYNRVKAIRSMLIEQEAQAAMAEKQKKLRRPLTQKEIDDAYRNAANSLGQVTVEFFELMAALDAVVRQADPAATTWDVTNVVDRKSLWKNYFTPTVTKGNIEQITRRHGRMGVGYPDILTMQHSCAVKHGNSGGPLLNAGGQVLGVVGDGMADSSSGDHEEVAWAIASNEMQGWLDTNHVGYITAQEWRKPQSLPVKIVIAIALGRRRGDRGLDYRPREVQPEAKLHHHPAGPAHGQGPRHHPQPARRGGRQRRRKNGGGTVARVRQVAIGGTHPERRKRAPRDHGCDVCQ